MIQSKQTIKANDLSAAEKIIELENQVNSLKAKLKISRKNNKKLSEWIYEDHSAYEKYKARMEKRFQERCFEENWIIKNHHAAYQLLSNSAGLVNKLVIRDPDRNLRPDLFKGIEAELMEMNESLSFIKKSIEDHDETNPLSMYCMNASLKRLN